MLSAGPSMFSHKISSGFLARCTCSRTGISVCTVEILIGQQYIGIIQYRFHPVFVGYEVGRDVTVVELDAVDVAQTESELRPLFDGDHAAGTDSGQRCGDHVADIAVVVSRQGGDVTQVGFACRLAGTLPQDIDDCGCCPFDSAFQLDGVGTGIDRLEAFTHHGLRENRRGGGPVAGDAVGFGGDFLDELRAHVGEGISQLDLLGDGDAIVGDGRRSGELLQHRVSALWYQRHLDRIGKGVHTHFEQPTGVLAESEFLCHVARTFVVS